MPSAPLLMLSAPFMLGPAPVDAAMDHALGAPAIEIAVADLPAKPMLGGATKRPEILELNWSLAQDAGQDSPPSGEDPAQTDENVIVVEGQVGPVDSDPVAAFNEESYRITQELDEVFLEPVAYAYRDGLPRPIRDGLGNVVRNLSEPINFLNFLLQFKFGKAIETLGRFAINSSLGLGGLIDVAGAPGIGLPYRPNGFANTLGFYGVDPGAYLYLPLTGATTVRDLAGSGLNQLVLPGLFGKPFNTPEFTIPFFIISSLDARLEVDAELDRIDQTVDPYAARRDSYLWRRARDIAELRGEETPPRPAIMDEVNGTGEFSEDFEEEDGAGSDAPDGSQISYQQVLETPEARPNLAITYVRVARTTVPGEAPRTR